MSEEIERLTVNGVSSINFIIGGSYGVSENVRKAVDMRLSFSKWLSSSVNEIDTQWANLQMVQYYKNTKYHK